MQISQKWSITNKASLMIVIFGSFFAASLYAQEQSGKIDRSSPVAITPAPAAVEKVVEKKVEPKPVQPAQTTDQSTANAQPKRVGSAVINLQTTVTGNQEQPRVMYILPWQSPAPEDVDFESLENQTKSVFSHIERDELRRELESLEKKTK